MKRDVGRGEQAVHQAFQRICLKGQPITFYQIEQTVDEGVAFEQGFPVKLVEDVILIFLLTVDNGYFAQQFGEITADGRDTVLRSEYTFKKSIFFKFRREGVEAVVFGELVFQIIGGSG